jgi:hypothetical protein
MYSLRLDASAPPASKKTRVRRIEERIQAESWTHGDREEQTLLGKNSEDFWAELRESHAA